MTTPHKNVHSPRLTIEVTQDRIDRSTQRDSSHCMIADALQEALPNAKFISVDLATIRFSDLNAGRRYIYLTPRSAQAAILSFDQGDKPEPFTVRISRAHVLPTGTGHRGKTTLEPSESGADRPVRVGGESPPLGPLAGGPTRGSQKRKLSGAGTGNRTGRRREFGLRAIIR